MPRKNEAQLQLNAEYKHEIALLNRSIKRLNRIGFDIQVEPFEPPKRVTQRSIDRINQSRDQLRGFVRVARKRNLTGERINISPRRGVAYAEHGALFAKHKDNASKESAKFIISANDNFENSVYQLWEKGSKGAIFLRKFFRNFRKNLGEERFFVAHMTAQQSGFTFGKYFDYSSRPLQGADAAAQDLLNYFRSKDLIDDEAYNDFSTQIDAYI